MNSNYRTAETLYSMRVMVCFREINVNTLNKEEEEEEEEEEDDDDDDINEIKTYFLKTVNTCWKKLTV